MTMSTMIVDDIICAGGQLSWVGRILTTVVTTASHCHSYGIAQLCHKAKETLAPATSKGSR